jgi:hypothetical protein
MYSSFIFAIEVAFSLVLTLCWTGYDVVSWCLMEMTYLWQSPISMSGQPFDAPAAEHIP